MALSVLNVLYTVPANAGIGDAVTCNKTFAELRNAVATGYWLSVKDNDDKEYKMITADWNNGIFVCSYANVTSMADGRCLHNNISITHLASGDIYISDLTSTYAQNGYSEGD